MVETKQTQPTPDERIAALEQEVAILREDVRVFIHAVYHEAGASKAAHTAVITLLQAMAPNAGVLPALSESLGRTEVELRTVDGLPDGYVDAFKTACARIISEAHRPAGVAIQ